MASTDALQKAMERYVAPIAKVLGTNKALQGLMQGFMATLPMTLGVALLSIISGLPIQPLQDFLSSTGLGTILTNALAVTINMQAIYIAVCIGYAHGKIRGINGMTAAVITLAAMLILVPISTQEIAPGYSTSSIPQSYLGSSGIFVAILLGLLIPAVTKVLLDHVSIKLPDSVPEFVSSSLSPTFAAIIVLTCVVLVNWGLSLTPFGNLFDLINGTVGIPIMNIGGSPLAYAIVASFAQLMWFFGIHPGAVIGVYMTVSMAVSAQNIAAFAAGQAVPALMFAVIGVVQNADSLAMGICAFFTKSERYKVLGRLSIVPALFNITEPLMFGVPIVLNPIMFVPFVLAKPIICALAALGTVLGLGNGLNPMISMPFVMPQFISTLFQGGIGLMVIDLVCIAAMVLLFWPFFRIADKIALKEEADAAAEADAA